MRQTALPATLALVVVAVILQTTLFGEGRLQPLGASPALVTLLVIATVRFLDPEPALRDLARVRIETWRRLYREVRDLFPHSADDRGDDR